MATGCTRQAQDSSIVDAFAQPWWIHAPLDESDQPRPGQDPRREFAGLAARLVVAAWMIGVAVASSFVTVRPAPGPASALAQALGRATSTVEASVSALHLSPSASVADAIALPVARQRR